MTDNVDWGYVCGNDTQAFAALLQRFYDILDSSFELFLLVEVPDELEQLGAHGVIREGVGDGADVELLLFGLHMAC